MSWIQHESSTDLRQRLEGIQNGIEAGTVSLCRRESDVEMVREITVELERRDVR